MGERFLLGEIERFLDFAAVERLFLIGDFEGGAAAGALGEDDLRDIEKRVDTCDLMDFLADELDRLFLRDEGDVDSFGRLDFLAAEVIATATVAVEVPAIPPAATLTAVSSAVIAVTATTSATLGTATATATALAGITTVVPAAGFEITWWDVLVFLWSGPSDFARAQAGPSANSESRPSSGFWDSSLTVGGFMGDWKKRQTCGPAIQACSGDVCKARR